MTLEQQAACLGSAAATQNNLGVLGASSLISGLLTPFAPALHLQFAFCSLRGHAVALVS